MDHGFLHSIRRIQVDRDTYDKEVKAAKSAQRSRPSTLPVRNSKTTKKPDRETYIPPTRRDSPNNGSMSSNASDLFVLEFEEENGEISQLQVGRHDEIASLAENFGKLRNFNHEMIEALANFLEEKKQRMISNAANS